jgi:hypothetical protein
MAVLGKDIFDFLMSAESAIFGVDRSQTSENAALEQQAVGTYRTARDLPAMTAQAQREALLASDRVANLGKWTAVAFVGGIAVIGLMLLGGKK